MDIRRIFLFYSALFVSEKKKMVKLTLIIALVLVCVDNIRASGDLEAAWEKYQAEFPIVIQSKSDYGIRKAIFSETHTKIMEHNAKEDATFEMEHNAFSVMTEEEQQSSFGAFKPVPPSNLTRILPSSRQLSKVDYRTDSCMPAVRNQGGCGSCWAHSATAVVEFGKCKKSGGRRLDFSEQQLVDCSRDNGCSGGWEHEAWQYLASNGGQAVENSYPYKGQLGSCIFSSESMTIGAEISSDSVQWIPAKDTNAMMSVLSEGRILSIYMQLPDSFMNYRSGVFNDNNCNPQKAHAMNVVGYGTLNRVGYWVVRNSWGGRWGAAGYVLVKKGVDLCMIESYVRTTNIA